MLPKKDIIPTHTITCLGWSLCLHSRVALRSMDKEPGSLSMLKSIVVGAVVCSLECVSLGCHGDCWRRDCHVNTLEVTLPPGVQCAYSCVYDVHVGSIWMVSDIIAAVPSELYIAGRSCDLRCSHEFEVTGDRGGSRKLPREGYSKSEAPCMDRPYL